MAFAGVYREKFGDGLIVPPNKTKLKLVYQPGWPMHLEPEIKYDFSGIPDVAALSGPQQTLKALVEQSTAMIDGYSRYLERNTAKTGTLEAFLNLPLRFWPPAERDRWQVFLSSIVDPMELVSFESLLRELGYVEDPALAKIMEIVTNLNRALVGFEPDILAGARRPKSSEIVVLFRLTSEPDSDRTTNEYKKASLTVSLSACIALADGHASEEEALAVEAMIASWQHLQVDLRTRLRAQYRLQVQQGISLASFTSRFSSLTADGRMQLALALSSLATVDGNIAAAEVKLLEQVYKALGLELQLLYSHLHGDSQCAHPLESPALRSVQEYAIPPLLSGTTDVILAAATSAGKTEAAFFPLLTRLLKLDVASGYILSISPLKALINDQTQRLTPICELLDLPILGWHGDVSASRKQKFLKEMSGVLIITPESLEALFVNKGTAIPAFARAAQCVVIDELHSFIGTERGKQVQSLLHRLEMAAERRMPRVGLSATLGDKSLAEEYLRPGAGNKVQTIDAAAEGYELKLIVKGYSDEWAVLQKPESGADETEVPEESIDKTEDDEQSGSSMRAIADYLYRHLRGSNNLVFPNSRSKVEYYADQLRRRCEMEGVPNEFWPHHGSLSRELREESEAALKSGETAASAICTTTLELGIDVGNIRSVAQIGPPPSVASLRQRLGRSGRRAGESAVLRCFVVERKLTPKSNFSDRIREALVQTVAMVRLLIMRWVEPPRPEALRASTLVQQILSVIAQKGGATAAELWTTLVRSGIFDQVGSSDFSDLLQALGVRDLITQDHGGSLLPGVLGEKLINQFDFYSAFSTGEEFRLIAEGRVLGSLPIERPLTSGQRIIFGGRRWKVLDIDTQGKAVYVVRDRGGAPPSFDGIGGVVHDRVRQEMKQVLTEVEPISFLDSKAAELLEEARQWFKAAGVGAKRWSVDGHSTLLFGWHGDTVQDALALLLTAKGMQASNEGVAMRISSTDHQHLLRSLTEIGTGPVPTIFDLKVKPEHAIREKWDWVLPEGLLLRSFASAQLDLLGAQRLALTLSQESIPPA